MKVVLDEGVPRQLADALLDSGLAADPFRTEWKQIDNGALLRVVEAEGYAVLVTNDKNMADQQSLAGRALVVVASPLNRRSSVMARVDDIADTIRRAKPGQHVAIGLDGTRRARSMVDGLPHTEDLPKVAPFAT